MNQDLQTIVRFIDAIGIPVAEAALDDEPFLPGVRIERGGLLYEAGKLRWPGDLLHEAGHIAVTPSALRDQLEAALDTERLPAHAGEVEAIAWSYAAVRHLGLDPAVVFHPDGYHGQSASLLLTYSLGVYPGAAGLAAAGMTSVGPGQAGAPVYPDMARWLRA